MSTRTSEKGKTPAQIQEGKSIPDDINIPNCTIEDVDRAVFDLFDKQLPFNYNHKSGQRRAPVIFATGERFAVLRRKEPLRDSQGALILPLVSIERTGVTQAPTLGAGTNQNAPIVIKKRLSPEDAKYQQLINKKNLKNDDALAAPGARTSMMTGSVPGRVASRRQSYSPSLDTRQGKLLEPELGENIFEVITIPAPKYYTAKYEITFWTQYTVQMNNMIMSLMALYQSYSQRTFRLETPKGYWFVGYVGEDLYPGNNFDDFTDSERLVRYSITMEVPAYIIGAAYNGAQNPIRKYISAPQISFDADVSSQSLSSEPPAGIPSGEADSYILEDMMTVDQSGPGQAVASNQNRSLSKNVVANIGGTTSQNNAKIIEIELDPFTGKQIRKRVFVKSRNRRSGETVLREDIT